MKPFFVLIILISIALAGCGEVDKLGSTPVKDAENRSNQIPHSVPKPKTAQEHLKRGNDLKNKGHLEKSIEEYHAAIRLNPNYAKVYHGLGVAMHQQGQWREAVNVFREALRLEPNAPSTHAALGASLLSLGKKDKGIAEFLEAIRLGGGDMMVQIILSRAVYDYFTLEEEIAMLYEATRVVPEQSWIRFKLLAKRKKQS